MSWAIALRAPSLPMNGASFAVSTLSGGHQLSRRRDTVSAACIITNCRKIAPAGEAFCSGHRDSPADKLKDRAIVAAEYRLHCSPHEWTDDDSEAMARYIIALHGPAVSRMPATLNPDKKEPGA